MDLIRFKDTCVIRRATGEKDELENEVFKTIYSGTCSYQKGGQTSYSIQSRNDICFLPTCDVIIYANDAVEVITEVGRKEGGIVKTPRDIVLDLNGSKVTKLELKQAKGE